MKGDLNYLVKESGKIIEKKLLKKWHNIQMDVIDIHGLSGEGLFIFENDKKIEILKMDYGRNQILLSFLINFYHDKEKSDKIIESIRKTGLHVPEDYTRQDIENLITKNKHILNKIRKLATANENMLQKNEKVDEKGLYKRAAMISKYFGFIVDITKISVNQWISLNNEFNLYVESLNKKK